MLHEISVENLGVIDRMTLVLQPGMTALTGETGAGKTLLITAISLLVGGRASPDMVRPGAPEARVDGRFTDPARGEELVLTRVVPGEGRSRAYMNGRPATATELAEIGADLVDLHGQHSHQSLLRTAVQRDCLDRFGGIDLAPLLDVEARIRAAQDELGEMGGDARQRAQELDLLRYQLDELESADLADPDEDELLAKEAEILGSVTENRAALEAAVEALTGDGGASDGIGLAVSSVASRSVFGDAESRLRALGEELTDVAHELRAVAERLDDDPDRLEQVATRRQLLGDLRRKYGDTLAEVIAHREQLRKRLEELETWEQRAGGLETELEQARGLRAELAERVRARRAAVAPELAAAIERHLHELAMPRARLEVRVDGDAGDDIQMLLGANPGEPPLPLARVASGGELARTMLAIRRVLSEAPPVLVFDEVDAGIGGQAALAVGRSLAALGATHQVLVVTHLPQVAAFADHHAVVEKAEVEGRTVSEARLVGTEERVLEVSRMLSGHPEKQSAQHHAADLLAEAAAERGR